MQSIKENYFNFLEKKPYERTPIWTERLLFCPAFFADNVARGMVSQQNPYEGELGGLDMFGSNWVFEPEVGGSIEIGCLLNDLSEWKEKLIFPDYSKMDWEGCAKENAEYLNTDKPVFSIIFTGFFERLISLVGFMDAAMALIDEEQKEIVKEIFDKLADNYIERIRYMKKYFGLDILELHDDWGTQRGLMFSVATHREMIFPYIKRVIDAAHEMGVYYEQHSCGAIHELVPAIIESGADSWFGQNSAIDKHMLVEEYGDVFRFGVEIRPPETLSDEEVMPFVKNLIDSYHGKDVWFLGSRQLGKFTPQAIEYIQKLGKV